MVGVENDGNTVEFSDLVDVLGGSDASGNGSFVVGVISGLSGNEVATSLGESDNDWTTVFLGGFHACIDGRCSNNVDSGNGESFFLGVIEKIDEGLSGDNTRLDGGRQLSEGL